MQNKEQNPKKKKRKQNKKKKEKKKNLSFTAMHKFLNIELGSTGGGIFICRKRKPKAIHTNRAK